MRRWIALACSVVILAAIAVVWQGHGKLAAPPNAGAGSLSETVLGVEALMQNVDGHRDSAILVEGVVSAVDTANQLFALIDAGEFQKCGTTTCAQLTLPVRWSGPMPLEREMIRVEGEIRESGGKLVFVAQHLEKVESQRGGFR